MAILFKDEMYALLAQGVFGNRLRTWLTHQEVVESGYTGNLRIRSRQVAGRFYECMPLLTALMLGEQLEKERHRIVYCESAVDENIVLQGEICETAYGLSLTYSTERVSMRAALKHPSYADGLAAKTILRSYLSPASYDEIMLLLDLYPYHIVEFTAFEHCVGELKGRTACVWEVRDY